MKKFLAILMAACLCISLAACGGGNGDSGDNDNNNGDGGNNGSVPIGEHKHVYTNKSACDLCGEEWHATETDAYTFMPLTVNGVEGYDVMFGEYSEINIVVDPFGRPLPAEPVIKGKPYEEEEIVLPCVHDGKPVLSVGRRAPCASEKVKKITLPDSIISFGAPETSAYHHGAFASCESLTELVLPNEPNFGGVKSFIGSIDAVPIYLGSLFGFGDGVASPLSQDYQDGVLYIGDYLIDVYSTAFRGPVFTVKDGTKGIAAVACQRIPGSDVEEVRIPDSVTEIGDGAFYAHDYYPNNGFQSSFKKVTFGANSKLKKIDAEAFYGCISLTDIALPNGLEYIGESAFESCTALSEIVIPDSVRRVGARAFLHTAYEEENIVRENYTENAEYVMQGDEIYNGNCLIKVNPDFEGTYTVREGTTAIAGGAFRECEKLTSVTLPQNLAAIEGSLFYDCVSLEHVDVPTGVTEIGDSAFDHCTALASITMPESLTTVGQRAFYECNALTSITFPEGVTAIFSGAFMACPSLQKIVLPHSLKEIGPMMYYGESLQEIEFHGTVEAWLNVAISGQGNGGGTITINELGMDYVTNRVIESVADLKIVCTDGTIAKDGTVTK